MLHRIAHRLGLWLDAAVSFLRNLRNSQKLIDDMKLLVAETRVQQIRDIAEPKSLAQVELAVFSQWGDDGIVQWLVAHLPDIPATFIEIGVEDYAEATTRYLLMRNSWRGHIVDPRPGLTRKLERSHWFWRYDLGVAEQFVTAENINQVVESAGFGAELGLLHIDIDGMDYWVWKALTVVAPALVIVEYNALFGSQRAITVPYQPQFDRMQAHSSGLYFGASYAALCALAHDKGYRLVGCSSAGNNLYFVRDDLPTLALEEVGRTAGFQNSHFRESRSADGNLTYLRGNERLAAISGMSVLDVGTNTLTSV